MKDIENKENDESAIIAKNLKEQKKLASEAEQRRLALIDMTNTKAQEELSTKSEDEMFGKSPVNQS